MRSPICWIALLALPLIAQDRPAGQGLNFYSLEKESALGRQLAAEATRLAKPLDSASVREYVGELGQRLAAQFPNPAFTYTFAVIVDDAGNVTHEPVAFPGGYLFVPASLFLAAQDEAEFAGMLAHSIAHVAARHYTRQVTRGQLVNMSTIPPVYRTPSPAVPLGFLRFKRDNELEADRLAADALAAAGFDPAALARYIGRVQPDEGAVSQAFSQLPTRSQRVTALEQVVKAMPAQTYPRSDGFQAIQDEVRRLMPVPPPTRPPTLRR